MRESSACSSTTMMSNGAIATQRFSQVRPSHPDTPLVTIGVPVYNSERNLRASLEAALAQTLTDIEVLISDNASTDSTPKICAEYVRSDPRVSYFRQPRNIGVARNWNFVAMKARGRYLKWMSSNDTCEPTMLARCVEVLEREPSVVLCYTRSRKIDETGKDLGLFSNDISFDDESASERFLCMCSQFTSNVFGGVVRVDALRRTRLNLPYPHSDRVLFPELALAGKILLLPEVLLNRRVDAASYSGVLSPGKLSEMFNPEARFRSRFVHLRRHVDLVIAVLRAPLSTRERIRSLANCARHLNWDRSALKADFRELFSREPRP